MLEFLAASDLDITGMRIVKKPVSSDVLPKEMPSDLKRSFLISLRGVRPLTYS